MVVLVTGAAHWFIPAELLLVNILENLYFLTGLRSKNLPEATLVRMEVCLLVRECGEVVSSFGFVVVYVVLCDLGSDVIPNGPSSGALDAESPKRQKISKKYFGHKIGVLLTDLHARNCIHFRWFLHTPRPRVL